MTRDWHAERYAAGEALAHWARIALRQLEPSLFSTPEVDSLRFELQMAIAEYERTKNTP